MAMKREKNGNGKTRPPFDKEAYFRTLRKTLTPAGELFAGRLDKALESEFLNLSCNGADAIKAHLEEHHLKTEESIKTINNLADHHANPRVTCYYLIMNHANLLLSQGRVHRYKGTVNGVRDELARIWTIYADRLVELGIEKPEHVEAARAKLAEQLANSRRGPFSLVGAVKSMFKKG